MFSVQDNQSLLTAGADLTSDSTVLIMLHGRGARDMSIIGHWRSFDLPQCTYIAPQAERCVWYPVRYNAPMDQNEDGLNRSLTLLKKLTNKINEVGVSNDRIIFFGFSQGASMALEYITRFPDLYGGVAALSGSLLGSSLAGRVFDIDLRQTPVFLGSGAKDALVLAEDVLQTEAALLGCGAKVVSKIYPDMGHSIDPEELYISKHLLEYIVKRRDAKDDA